MTNLISGKEAKLAWANGGDVEFRILSSVNHREWKDIYDAANGFSIQEFDAEEIEFRLKPRTITINGIEVPCCGKDYKPHTFMFILNSLEPCEYSKIILDESDEIPPYWWCTEDEIKQVVAALRQIFGGV